MRKPKNVNKDYTIEAASINRNQSYNIGNTTQDLEISVDLTLRILNKEKFEEAMYYAQNSTLMLESFLSGVPEWCTPEMLHKALKKEFPERFL